MLINEELEFKRITNRNVAKIMKQLDEIETPEITKNTVKKFMWFLANDLKTMFEGGNYERKD